MVNDSYCSNCERQLLPHSKHCPHCGTFNGDTDEEDDAEIEPEPTWKLYAALAVAILSAALILFMIFVV